MTQPEAKQLRERALALLSIEREQMEEQMALGDFRPGATRNQRLQSISEFQNSDSFDNSSGGFERASAPPHNS